MTYAEPIEAQLDIDEAHTDDPLPAEERITGPCEQEDCE